MGCSEGGRPQAMRAISCALRPWMEVRPLTPSPSQPLLPPSSHPAPRPRSPQGEMNALFLRHEGFLGAVGAFLKVHPMSGPNPL